MKKVDNDLEELIGFMGPFGRYQMFQFVLLALASVNAGVHMLSLVTVAAVPEHRCFVPEVDELLNGSVRAVAWNDSRVADLRPTRPDNSKDSCHLLDEVNGSAWTPCERWVFDDTYYVSSRAIEWEMVCDKRWMEALAKSVYMSGLLVGAVLLGNQADRFGRKPVFMAAAVLQLVVGTLVAFVPDFWSFLVLRFLYGVGTVGTLSSSFVLIMEMVGPTYRTGFGMAFQSSFSVGIVLVALWGYLIPDRQLLQAVYGLHSLLLLPQWWLVDESARWLWSQGRTRDAVRVVSRASRMNYGDKYKSDIANFLRKDSATADATGDVAEEAAPVPQVSIRDLFKTPNMCRRMFNVSLNWFANSLVYYGLSLNTGQLAGNPFLNLFVAGVVDVPSYILTGILMNLWGRRSLISTLMILGGLACITAAFLSSGDDPVAGTAATAIVMIGKFFIAGSFAIIYNYSTELFPTAVRNTALGASSMCARISGALCPFISLLDSLNKSLPSTIFGCVAITSGLLSLFLPETLGRPLPQTMEEGEHFGDGDTAFSSCLGRRRPASRAASERGRRSDSPTHQSLRQGQDSHEMS
ncbi:Organic cation transporter protein [Frankliniella fusca]|uniref:Organic cation transporter protein n=1 Tax=Frankliniella fusca TaxID=407009 RepID=A0AAE1HR23_9NEOP|nr:Organic cation transporter protein [Frankliniella fusca]